MRKPLLALVLGLTTGCHGLGHRCEPVCSTPCAPEQPRTAPAPQAPRERAAEPAPRQEVAAPRAAAVAQDIMLVPRTVYVPYAPQTPIAPVRLAGIAQQPLGEAPPRAGPPSSGEAPPRAGAPTPGEAPPREGPPSAPCNPNQELLDMLRGLNQRLDRLEQAPRETIICPPAPCTPTRQTLRDRLRGVFSPPACEVECPPSFNVPLTVPPPMSIESIPLPKGPAVPGRSD